MLNFFTSAGDASRLDFSFGPGGLPFPPGIQTNFRDIEVTHNYVEFFVGQVNPLPVTSKLKDKYVIGLQLDFVIAVSGENFGSPV